MVGAIGTGLLVLVGVEKGDDESRADGLAERLSNLRIFADPAGKMNRSVRDVGGEVLLVSQFTLVASLGGGRRPSFDRAAPPDRARALYERVIERLRETGLPVASGSFGDPMEVELVNDGPVTFLLEQR